MERQTELVATPFMAGTAGSHGFTSALPKREPSWFLAGGLSLALF
jgi:hypothetical protein